MKISKTLAIGCAALMGVTAFIPAEGRSYRRAVRYSDDGPRYVRYARSRPRVAVRGARYGYRNPTYYRASSRRYYRSYPRVVRYRSYPRVVRYRSPAYYSGAYYNYPSYYYSGYPRYYSYPSSYYYSDPYYYSGYRRPAFGGISISIGGGSHWGHGYGWHGGHRHWGHRGWRW